MFYILLKYYTAYKTYATKTILDDTKTNSRNDVEQDKPTTTNHLVKSSEITQ